MFFNGMSTCKNLTLYQKAIQMDTRFWGPSGWKFLHLLLEMMPVKLNKTEQKIVKQFMLCWRDLLPCKYCRKSFTKYTTSYPIDQHLDTRLALTRWLFVIHNKVNNKLRRQGYCNYENPDFALIQELYQNLASNTNNPIRLLMELGHDFLGSIIINYSAYVHNNPEQITAINGFYYRMAQLLAEEFQIVVSQDKRYYRESAPIIQKMHTYYQNTPLVLADDGSSNDELISWYYGIICMVNSHYCVTKVNQFVKHFEPYIVDSCNKKHSSQKLNSCRKKKTIKMVAAKSRKYTRRVGSAK